MQKAGVLRDWRVPDDDFSIERSTERVPSTLPDMLKSSQWTLNHTKTVCCVISNMAT
jgi:hypothetical protein